MSVQHWFDPKYLSHKFNSNGLKYELGFCIQTGNIVRINGRFRASFHDIDICRQALRGTLDEDEVVEVDGEYQGEHQYLRTPKDAKDREEWKRYRHDLKQHSSVFRAVVVITQLSIEHRSPLYSVEDCNQIATNK
eukprot:CCRYP_002318-RA/>CCRYP_002318-RA protein AED:0.15 eAED:0.15 QI:0/0/0/1/0/0/2/0/134